MIDDVVIEMMSSDFILWRCLHNGPLTRETVDHPKPHPMVPWDRIRARNMALLAKLTEVYGSCAVLARDNHQIVGQLRFYPRGICSMAATGPGLCVQQLFPNGPADDLVERTFLPLEELADKALYVHCMMTASGATEDQAYRRKGLASRMVRTLIDWAREKEWQAIQADAYLDLPSLYAVTGQAGRGFWEKQGFSVVDRTTEPAFVEEGNRGFVEKLREEAAERGIAEGEVAAKYRMRLVL